MTGNGENQDRVRQFYNQQIDQHPEMPAILGSPTRLHADFRSAGEWDVFLRLFSVNRQFRVLELGCGGGRWAASLSPLVSRVVGVDISENAVGVARERASRLGLENVEYVVSSIVAFAPSGKFDLVYFSGVLLYLSDAEVQQALSNLAGHLADDAIVLVRDSVTSRPYRRTTPQYEACYRDETAFREMFKQIGYRLEQRRQATPPVFSRRAVSSRIGNRIYQGMCRLGAGNAAVRLLHWASKGSSSNLFPNALDGIPYSHDFLVFRPNPGGGR